MIAQMPHKSNFEGAAPLLCTQYDTGLIYAGMMTVERILAAFGFLKKLSSDPFFFVF
jgi:hypothetical protein